MLVFDVFFSRVLFFSVMKPLFLSVFDSLSFSVNHNFLKKTNKHDVTSVEVYYYCFV